MTSAQYTLGFLIGVTPVLLFFNGPLAYVLTTVICSGMLVIAVSRLRFGEADFVVTLFRPLGFFTAIPALWMLIQILPLEFIGLTHPIWKSASDALGHALRGGLSIDPGTTLISLVRYLSTMAIVFVTIIISVDRQRAEWILFGLTATTTVIAIAIIVATAAGQSALIDAAVSSGAVINVIALGFIATTTALIRTWEHGHNQRSHPNSASPNIEFLLTFACCGLALVSCLVAAAMVATANEVVGIGFGLVPPIGIFAIRRFQLGLWGRSAVAATTVVIAIAAISLLPKRSDAELVLAFATQPPAAHIATTQRILTDASWAGTGAGTFTKIQPLYHDRPQEGDAFDAPTAAAAIQVELGRALLWAIAVFGIALAVSLLRGALQRGRDFFYPAAGAGCVVAMMLQAFTNAGLFSSAVSILAAAMLGMAIAQSRSRRIR